VRRNRSLSKRYAASYREINDSELVTLPDLALSEQKDNLPLQAWPVILAIAPELFPERVFISSPAGLKLQAMTNSFIQCI